AGERVLGPDLVQAKAASASRAQAALADLLDAEQRVREHGGRGAEDDERKLEGLAGGIDQRGVGSDAQHVGTRHVLAAAAPLLDRREQAAHRAVCGDTWLAAGGAAARDAEPRPQRAEERAAQGRARGRRQPQGARYL